MTVWREATREEIYSFYQQEFPTEQTDFPPWIMASGPKQYALALRPSHPVVGDGIPDRDFIRRDTRLTDSAGNDRAGTFQGFGGVIDFIQSPARADPLQRDGSEFALADPMLVDGPDPVPEAVYYALDHWERN